MKFKQALPLLSLFLLLSTFLAPTTANSVEDKICDIVVEHSICTHNGDKNIFPNAAPEGLVGHWSFDDDIGLDSSGNRNHVTDPSFKAGPGMGGIGYSAAIGGTTYVTIPPSTLFDSNVFSVTFWVFLIREGFEEPKPLQGTKYCPLVYKGNENAETNEIARAPAIMLDRKERTIQVAVTTSANDTTSQGEILTSNAKIPYNKWTHVALVRLDKKIRLYVNGILDAVVQTLGSTLSNNYPLYIGNTPFLEEDCSIPAYIDEFRFYTRDLSEQEIEAEASPALGNMNPSFVQLGCINCVLSQASASCIEGYHLCSTIELHSGVFQIARSLGWTTYNSKIWSYGATKLASANSTEELGLGVCCID